ncbi:MAG: zinc ribbon domain-containing protein [Candidatus Krumholzibacteria bacterium]|nr:zinc ribbon domain-containing protein [Candidatus Krumholzibacteria bacterium]
MVTYRYSCEKCGYEFDFEQRITAPPKKRCPKCRGNVYRVIHAVGHILKGSGFYTTDNRNKDFRKREKEESAGAMTPADSNSTKHKDKK